MGKAGKLKKQAATKRLEVLKKKIKAIAKDELQIKKSGPIGHLGMDEILAEIKTQINAPKSSNPLAAIQSKSGALENVRDLIETYRNVERMISNFDEKRPDNILTRREMEKIEAWLESIEISTGIAKERPGFTQEEIINRNILARIDKGLKKEVDELEQAIASSPDEFENPAVKLRDAIERAKSKIHRNQQLIAENKKDEENENDDEKEHAILKWEIEINKIERQINALLATGQNVSIDSELNTHVEECRTMLEDARRILAVVKDESKPYLSENDRLRINQILAETRKFATENRTPTPTVEQREQDEEFGAPTEPDTKRNSGSLDDLLSEVFSDSTPQRTSEEQRQEFLDNVGKLAAKKVFNALSIVEFTLSHDYESEIPKIFTGQYEPLGNKLSAFLKEIDAIRSTTSLDEIIPENVRLAYEEILAVLPEEYKNQLPARLGEQPQSQTKSTSTQVSDTPQIQEQTLSEDQKKWLKVFATAAKSISEHPTFVSYDYIAVPDVTCKDAFTGNIANIGILAQAFHDACDKVPTLATNPEFQTKLDEAKKAYNLLIEALPQSLQSAFELPKKFEASTPSATSKTSSTVRTETKVKSPYITLDGSNKLLFEKLKEELKKSNPDISVIDKLIDDLIENQFAKGHELGDRLRDLQLEFLALDIDETPISPETFKELSRYIESLPVIENAPTYDTPFNTNNIQFAIELQTLLSSENTITDRMRTLVRSLLDDDSFIQKNGAEHPLLVKLNALIHADATTEKKQIEETSDLLTQWVQKPQTAKIIPDTTRTQEIERLRTTVDSMHQQASRLLEEPNRRLANIQTLLSDKSESQQRTTLERIDQCRIKLESMSTRLVEIGRMEDILEKGKAYQDLMRNTAELSGQIASIEADVKSVIKKTSRVDTDEADLREHPRAKVADPDAQITIGDMHGNTMKLIHFLIQQGVMELASPEEYKSLRLIYEIFNDDNAYRPENKDNLKSQLVKFNDIINRAKINDPAPTIRLIGDELADRGANDYLTLKVLEKLSKSGTNVEILMSNHSIEFLGPIEKGREAGKGGVTEFNNLGGQQGQSDVNLYHLIDLGVVNFAEVQELVDNHYKKFTRALSYTLSEDKKEITIFSHAAIGMKQLVEIAEVLGIHNVESPQSAVEIAKLIDDIIDEMMKRVLNNTLHEFTYRTDNNPIGFLFWNRDYNPDILDRRPELANGDKCNWAHGHDSNDPLQDKPHIKMLDSSFGKFWHDPFMKTSDQMKNPVLTTYGTSPRLALVMTQEQQSRLSQEKSERLEREHIAEKNTDKEGVRAAIENTKNLGDLLAFIEVTDDAFAGLGNEDCRAAVRKLGHDTSLDADELKEFLEIAQEQAFSLAKDITLSAINDSSDNENMMKLLLSDPKNFTNNAFKDALSKIVKDDKAIETLVSNKDNFDISELLQIARENLREGIVQKAEKMISSKDKDDNDVVALNDADNEADVKAALKTLLGAQLYNELFAVEPTDDHLNRLTEAARFVVEDAKAAREAIEQLHTKITEIKDIKQLNNLSILLQVNATLDDADCRDAFANLFKLDPSDPEDPRIRVIVDEEADLHSWFGTAIKQTFEDLARKAAIELIENKDGKPSNYANMLGEFIEAEEDEKIEDLLKDIVGEDLINHLKLAGVELSDFKKVAQQVLAPIALDAAMTNLEAFDGSASELSLFISALKLGEDERSDEQDDLIDKALGDPSKNLRYNLDTSECDLSLIIKLAQDKLAPLAITEAKQAVSAIAVTGAGYNPNELIDFIKSASSAPPDPTRFDKLKAIIDPALVDQLKTANITDLAVIVTQARDKLYEYTSTILLDKLKTASADDLTRLMNEPRTIHGVLASFREIINNISGIANFHETVQLIETGNINQLLERLKPEALIVRTKNAAKLAVDHIQKITDLAVLNELSKLDGNQLIDATQSSRLINLLGREVDKFLPGLIDANPKVKMNIFVEAAKQRMASFKITELQENIALFQGRRDAMMQCHKETNLSTKLDFLVSSGIVPSAFVSQLRDADPNDLKKAINDAAKQWVTANLIKSAMIIIESKNQEDQLPVINTLADLSKFGFSPDELMYLNGTTELDQIKLAIEQRKEAIRISTSTPPKNIAQIRDVRDYITNRATISDLEALRSAVIAGDEAQCKIALKRRGFSDESLSELKTPEFTSLLSAIDTQLSEMKLQETAATSAKNNLDNCETALESSIRERDAIQREYDTQLAIIDDETADEDDLNDVDAELEVLKPQLEEAKSKVAIARLDLNHARERFERADTIAKDKQNRLHQSELLHLQAQSKQVEAKQKERERLIKLATDANTGVTTATTEETEAKRLLELAKVPKRTTESDADFSTRQSTIPELTKKHAEKEGELAEAKRIKTEADRVLKDARATKSDTALQEELTAATQTVVAHKNRQPPQTSDEPRKRTQRQLQEDDTVNQNASRTDLDARKREAEESLKKALKRESKLIARKAELESLLASNPSQSIKQAAQTELTQLKRALESVRKHINANEALIAGTISTASKDTRKKLEVEAKLTEDEANTCMRDYKQANKYTNDKITIADHIRTNIMAKPQTLTTLEKLADNYIVQLEYLAKRGHDENAKEELSSLLDKSAKLHAQLEIYKDELNKEILHATADREKLLATLQKVNAILMGLKKAQQAYHQPLAEVGSLCIISDPPICNTEDEINDQIANILGSSSSSSSGYLGSGVAKINTTETFKEAAGRVTKMELEDGRALRGGTFNAAVVQKSTPSGGFVTLFHVNDSDKARITGNTSLTAGAKLIEEHRLGNHHSSDPIDICGKFPPQMVKDMILYCEAKGYKYNNLTDTTFTPSAKKVSDLQEKLDTEKVKKAIFGTAKELGTSKAKITALEKEIKLDETPVPTSTRPST